MKVFALHNIYGRLIQKSTAKALTVGTSSLVYLAPNTDKSQLWRHQNADEGYYYLLFPNPSAGPAAEACLGVFNGTFMATGLVNSDNQRWRYEDVGEGYFKLVHKTGLVLGGDGTKPQKWNGSDDQRWALAVAPQVDRSKRYNQVTFAMAHDSHTATKYYSDEDSVPENVDQTQPVSAQLRGGIRALRISTGIESGAKSIVILQHGNPNDGYRSVTPIRDKIPRDFGLLDDYLVQVRDFLNAPENRNEVVTIYDEGDSNNKLSDNVFEDEMALAYMAAFGGITENGRQIPGGWPNGSGVKVYCPSWGQGYQDVQWDTLQSMVDRNARLIVIRANGTRDGRYPWILKAYAHEHELTQNLIATNPSQYYGDYDRRPAWVVVKAGHTAGVLTNKDGQKVIDFEEYIRKEGKDFPKVVELLVGVNHGYGTLDKPNTLYLFNHFFYRIMDYDNPISQRDESVRGYNKWTVGDLLIENTLRAWMVNNYKPNFINVDFYQGVKKATSYLLPLVDAMNTIDVVSHPFKPSYVTDQMGDILLQDAGELKINGLYNIRSSASNNGADACYLGVAPAGSVTLAKDPTDPAQQWKLVYNTPYPGIALVNNQVAARQILADGNNQELRTFSNVPSGSDPLDELDISLDAATSGFEIRLVGNNEWVIRRSLDWTANLTVRGRNNAVQMGDRVGVEEWHDDGQPAQKWVFTLVNA